MHPGNNAELLLLAPDPSRSTTASITTSRRSSSRTQRAPTARSTRVATSGSGTRRIPYKDRTTRPAASGAGRFGANSRRPVRRRSDRRLNPPLARTQYRVPCLRDSKQHPGDANNDGAVDVVDLGILAKNYDTADRRYLGHGRLQRRRRGGRDRPGHPGQELRLDRHSGRLFPNPLRCRCWPWAPWHCCVAGSSRNIEARSGVSRTRVRRAIENSHGRSPGWRCVMYPEPLTRAIEILRLSLSRRHSG